jgi:hypothetical protein
MAPRPDRSRNLPDVGGSSTVNPRPDRSVAVNRRYASSLVRPHLRWRPRQDSNLRKRPVDRALVRRRSSALAGVPHQGRSRAVPVAAVQGGLRRAALVGAGRRSRRAHVGPRLAGVAMGRVATPHPRFRRRGPHPVPRPDRVAIGPQPAADLACPPHRHPAAHDGAAAGTRGHRGRAVARSLVPGVASRPQPVGGAKGLASSLLR